MNLVKLARDRWLTIYTTSVLVSFGLGFLLKARAPEGSSFYPAALLTLPWSALPHRVMPQPVNEFLDAFYHLPLILAAMTLNIAFVGLIQWVCFRLPAE
jgi:hypothetical protein